MERQDWDERYAGAELLWTAEPNRFLVAEVQDLPAGRALDVACGEGRNAVWLAQRGWQVTGVDFSPVALDKARKLADARGVVVTWVLADVVDYEPAPRGFDLVAVLYLQLPANQRRRALRHAVDAVAQGGTLLVVGHADTNLTDGWGGPRDAAILYSPDDVAAETSELEIVKAERVRRPVVTEDGEKSAIDTLVRATRVD